MGRLVRRHWQADLGSYGGRQARQSFTYEAYVPDPIAERLIGALNEHTGTHNLEAIARQLLRAESVASSRIEGLELSQCRVAEALFDPEHSDATARSVLNNILAMSAPS